MTNKKQVNYFILFILLYFLLNIFNTYFLSSELLNRYISPVSRSFFGELNSVVGNFSILFLFLLISFVFFKKDKNKLIFLTSITFILNLVVFALGIFNMYYQTAFATNALDLFNNPAEGIANGLVIEVLIELVLYYRILVFVPFIVLLAMFFRYRRFTKFTNIETIIKFNALKYFQSIFIFAFTFVLSTASFIVNLNKSDFLIGSLISTEGVQNFGTYPFYLLEFLGVDFDYTSIKNLSLDTDQKLFVAYDTYNKNKKEYKNMIDGKTYSNDLTLEESVLTEFDNLNKEDSLSGIFKGKNLVLVHLESVNHFLFEIPEVRERFVFLNEIFKESFVFDNYYTSVGMGVSSDAEASVLTGLYMNGYSTFYTDNQKEAFDIDATIPKLFERQGYKSQAVHGDHEVFYGRDLAYPSLMGFTEDYYSLEDFAKDSGYDSIKSYSKDRMDNGYMIGDKKIVSPWPSEFELSEKTYELSKLIEGTKHMMFSVYMMPHTPFEYNPYSNIEYDIKNYNKLKGITKRYLEFASYIDDTIKSYFFDPITNEKRIDDNTVYIFYGDHGSGLKNGDLNILYDRNLDVLEEREKLQKIISFIYAPKSSKDDTKINEGILKGNQQLVRGHVDLYRTIGDLFGLFTDNDFYFGTHGLSKEPTFVIDNRVQDVVIQDTNNNYPYIVSLRNVKNKFPNDQVLNMELIDKIKYFKKISDLLLLDRTIYPRFKALQKSN